MRQSFNFVGVCRVMGWSFLVLVAAAVAEAKDDESKQGEILFEKYVSQQENGTGGDAEKTLNAAYQYLLNLCEGDDEKALKSFETMIRKHQIKPERAAALLEKQKRKICENHLKMVGISFLGYTAKKNGSFPDTLEGLGKAELAFIKKYLFCPNVLVHQPLSDFTYTGKGRRDDNKMDIMLVCQNHGGWIHVLYSDLQVEVINVTPGKAVFEGEFSYVNPYISGK